MTTASSPEQGKLGASFGVATLLICLLPGALHFLGVDFSSSGGAVADGASMDQLHQALTGSFIHTILEWSAFCTAAFIAVLSFAHYSATRDATAPVIGMALFCAGVVDAFHTLAADRLIEASVDSAQFIPFTWAVSRLFNALVLLAGTGLVLLRSQQTGPQGVQREIRALLITGALFVGLAMLIVHASATATRLPPTQFPGEIVTRPWDVVPLVLYLVAGLVVFPRYQRRHPGVFAQALVISAIPQVVTQLHMAFGSSALFDAHFNLGHFVKILAYLVPFAGLVIDYVHTYRSQTDLTANLEARVAERTGQLAQQADLVRQEAEALTAATGGIAAAASQLAASTSQTAGAISEATAGMEQIETAARAASQAAEGVAQRARKAAEVAEGGTRTTAEMEQAMAGIDAGMHAIAGAIDVLSEHSRAIGESAATVDALGEESHLLAINAALQAARAGDEGRAFAVVATRVRGLAAQTRAASKRIREVLSEVHTAIEQAVDAAARGATAVERGVDNAHSTGAAIRELGAQVDEAAAAAVAIAAGSQQQVASVEQIARTMEGLQTASRADSDSTDRLNEEVRALKALGERLAAVSGGAERGPR